MVSTKTIHLNLEIKVDIPIDILDDKHRLELVQNGIIQSISKGLYQEGISFSIEKVKFHG